MYDMRPMIDQLYTAALSFVLEGFEEKDTETVKKRYLEKLEARYGGLGSQIANDQHYNMARERFLKFETDKWSKKTLDEKKRIFLDDPAIDEIIDISAFAYQSAKDRMYNGILISKERADELIDRLVELDKIVQPFNKQLSEWYLSESAMDLTYACGKTENTSLRIGHIR